MKSWKHDITKIIGLEKQDQLREAGFSITPSYYRLTDRAKIRELTFKLTQATCSASKLQTFQAEFEKNSSISQPITKEYLYVNDKPLHGSEKLSQRLADELNKRKTKSVSSIEEADLKSIYEECGIKWEEV